MKITLEQLKKHPLYSESDYNYLKNKGLNYDEIKAILDKDYASGHRTPMMHTPSPDQAITKDSRK